MELVGAGPLDEKRTVKSGSVIVVAGATWGSAHNSKMYFINDPLRILPASLSRSSFFAPKKMPSYTPPRAPNYYCCKFGTPIGGMAANQAGGLPLASIANHHIRGNHAQITIIFRR